MPPFPIPTGFAQVTLNWSTPTFVSGHGATVLGFRLNTGTLHDCTMAVGTAWGAHINAEQNTEITLDSVVGLDAISRSDIIVGASGSRSGGMATPNVCALVKLDSDLRGRHNRGRSYWPGLLNAGDVNDTGDIDTRAMTITGAMTGFYGAISTAGFDPVILHKNGSAPTPVGSIACELKAATQRRRLR